MSLHPHTHSRRLLWLSLAILLVLLLGATAQAASVQDSVAAAGPAAKTNAAAGLMSPISRSSDFSGVSSRLAAPDVWPDLPYGAGPGQWDTINELLQSAANYDFASGQKMTIKGTVCGDVVNASSVTGNGLYSLTGTVYGTQVFGASGPIHSNNSPSQDFQCQWYTGPAKPPGCVQANSQPSGQVFVDIANASNTAKHLTPTQTFSTIDTNGGNVTVNVVSGLNVINIPSDPVNGSNGQLLVRGSGNLIINGPASAVVIFNVGSDDEVNTVSGGMDVTTSSILLSGGVQAQNVLFNVLAGDVTASGVGSTEVINGTILVRAGSDNKGKFTGQGALRVNGSVLGDGTHSSEFLINEEVLVCKHADRGDAPDTAAGTATGNYNTLMTDTGPFHVVVSTLKLGAVTDTETDGQPTTNALGDDANPAAGPDDEESIIAPASLVFAPGSIPAITVRATNTTGAAASLRCWMDLNKDGDFLDAGEASGAGATTVASGGASNHTLNFGAFTATGTTYLRCRLSSAAAGVASATGPATSLNTDPIYLGEVEDHLVTVQEPSPVCLGEAATFGILGLDNGSISINSATDIIGDVGYSRGLTSTTNQKAGDDGVFLGTVYVHSQVAAFSYTSKDFLPSGGIVGYPTGVPAVDSRLDQANADALAASANYASQPVHVNLGNLGDNDNRTVNRVGPVTVVQIGSWTYNSDILTLVGQAGQDDAFIVNVLGNLDFSQSEIRLTNVRPERVVFNFPNASTLLINKSATIWKGTILAPTSSVEYHNPASFEGAIVAKNITVHSDFNLIHRKLDINCNVPLTPAITVEKYVSVDNQDTWEDADSAPGPTTAAGTPVYFKFVVVNTGNVTLSSVSLSDTDFTPLTGCAAPSSLAAGQDYQCVYGPVAAVTGQHSNTATASGSYNGNPVQDTDPAHYFGNVILIGSIGDYVWNDINGNGLQDDGPNRGLNSVTVRLYQDDGDGIYEPGTGDTLLSSQDTAGDGGYSFTSLTAGNYWVDVDEADLPGYTAIVGAESEPQPLFVELLAGEDFTVADFGYAGRGTISGVVFYDWDESGDQGLGEDGIPNVPVCLYRDTDNDGIVDFGSSPIACLNSGPDGSYLFTNQLPGDYLVVETPPPGLENTTPILRDVQLVVIGASGSAPDNDFGHVNFGSIGDFIYLDSNGNGQQDLGENIGIAGVPVTVRNVSTLEETTVVSGPTGLYTVGDLAPGVYEVSTPASWPGLARTTLSPKTVNLGQGQNYVLADFGYIAPTAVQFASFTATAQGGGAMVRWATSYEREQEGFRVWRSTAAEGAYKQVSGLIVAANVETGASYEWLDTGATGGRYWYKIESVPDGQWFGPVGTEAEQGLTRIFAPLIVHRR